MNHEKTKYSIETNAVYAGEPTPRIEGAVSMPIFQSAMYEFANEKSYEDIKYIRLNNTPNHKALHEKLAVLENGEAAMVTSSGMAAISTALLTVLSSGDHALVHECLYSGTHALLVNDFPNLNISTTPINGCDPNSWQDKVRSNTKVIYVETISNPLMQVPDLEAIVSFAQENKLIAMIDNTFATPINFRPLDHGFDLVLHSATKYLNGHSDLVAGAVIGKKALMKKIAARLGHLGGSLDPHGCFLLHRGLKTLALRVHYQNQSALKLAGFLEEHPKVKKVNYSGIQSHPQHAIAKKLFKGFGGMLSFELKDGPQAAEQLINHLKIPVHAPSLGGVESLITRPATSSHLAMAREEREAVGITDQLVRFSVGIESTDDLIQDFQRALEYVPLP